MKIMCELTGLVVFNLGRLDCCALRSCTKKNHCWNLKGQHKASPHVLYSVFSGGVGLLTHLIYIN